MCNQTASLEQIIQYINYIGLLRTLYNNAVAKRALNIWQVNFNLIIRDDFNVVSIHPAIPLCLIQFSNHLVVSLDGFYQISENVIQIEG